MIYCIENETGRIRQIVHAPDSHAEHYEGAGISVLVSDEVINASTHYVVADEFVPIPVQPSPHHEWDWPTKSWLPNLDAAKAAKKAEIEAERNLRISEPLIYDGKVLDADQAARDNLKAKLEEVRERIRLNMPMAPELLVWRDNGNQTHSWPYIEAYHDWLAGYAVAMSDRGTRCYACAWYHKDALKAANDSSGQPWTVETIAAHDITPGWPA